MIDLEYLSKLIIFINQRENVRFKVSDLSTDPPKMVEHLRYYIDHKSPDMLEVEFVGEGFDEFRVQEFFEGINFRNDGKKQMIARLWP